jgi:hypothetical protein
MYRGLLLVLLLSSSCGIQDLFWSRETKTTIGPEMAPAVLSPIAPAAVCPPPLDRTCKTEAHVTCSCEGVTPPEKPFRPYYEQKDQEKEKKK